jgi:drug/metabolite transporter (DMT)-like permease
MPRAYKFGLQMTRSALPRGPLAALGAALLFGASTPLAKAILGAIDPWLAAGLLYAGSGLGLAIVWLVMSKGKPRLGVSRADWPWLLAAILFGGGLAPVLLMLGLSMTDGATSSLLLTLEGVFTAVLAWVAFREHVHGRLIWGMLAIAIGAAVLAWSGAPTLRAGLGPLLIAGACLAWGIDNNLTRRVALNDAVVIAMLKGLVAGVVNLLLARLSGAGLPALPAAAGAMAIGFTGYGLSLVLYVLALRQLGAGRTGAYFSVAPFLGAVIAVIGFGAPVTPVLFIAAALMGLGVWLHLTEKHEHRHTHDPMSHAHAHVHDEHHQHAHGPDDPLGEPHVHAHEHTQLTHSHPHFPDAHHRHRHKRRA